MLGGDTLDGQRDDLLRLPLRVAAGRLADLPDPVRRGGLGFLLHSLHELGLGVLRAHPGQLLQPAAGVQDRLVELELLVGDELLLATELARATAELLVTLLQLVEPAVDARVALLHTTLLPLHLVAPPAGLLLPRLAQFDELFLSRQDRALAQGIGFPLGLADDAAGRVLGRRVRRSQPPLLLLAPRQAPLVAPPRAAENEKGRGGETQYNAIRGERRDRIHDDLCSGA
ncbi:MAG: hypothetical protein AVDCRST_MAG11-3763 [uncultured Gemmatimonadaceae bacterium]|uniref:Uncharacterized protein n=1 Tax=uncultured Gemmatimonadaceae bacterium TaxID=246130 RepID=A0A6J4MDW0_9BACT|nr:MAG: hypothetical protein AVDCRST_MAG11-3763 [uncultured Gemmatimonadaceae bacterium]